MRKACSYQCSLDYLESAQGKKAVKVEISRVERQDKAERRERVKQAKGYGHWAKVTQKDFNLLIRTRDKGLACPSCGKHEHDLSTSSFGSVWDAGHFKSVGAHPELRFNTHNVHGQCRDCNGFKGGNIDGYREGLKTRYGQWILDYLDGSNEAKNYTIADLERGRKIIRKAIKRIERRG